MFKENFVRLCQSIGKSPNAVCREVGLSTAAYSEWREDTVPRRTTLIRIADYFGVPVESLTADSSSSVPHFDLQRFASPTLTPAEQNLLEAYRSDASLRSAIDAMLEATGHGLNGKKPASSDA